jgi:hypothetical protein
VREPEPAPDDGGEGAVDRVLGRIGLGRRRG